jgi:surface polysaccharide O-acyltransferase-like enzyme
VENGFTRLLSQNSFGIYMFHSPILIAISLLLRSLHGAPLLKFAVVSALAVPASFAFSYAIRRVGFLRKVFS